jgi:hypothetical protein
MRWVGLVAVGAALAGCAFEPGMTWVRLDGRPADPALEGAIIKCRDIVARISAASPPSQRQELTVTAMEGCMAKRGYKWACNHPLANPFTGVCAM